MVEVIHAQRKSAVLSASPLRCLHRMPTINLNAGCAHGCLYCYAQGYCHYPGGDKVLVYQNTLDKLRHELARKRRRPEMVAFSPSSDLFQPVPEVLDLAYDVLALLFRHEIRVSLLSKGRIPKRHFELLAAHAPLVRAQVGLITLDQRLLHLVEPQAAPARVRLEQIRQLTAAGVSTQARLDPILPGLTDDPGTLHALCAALAAAGIKDIAASMLFLRPALAGVLWREARRQPKLRKVLAAFAHRTWLPIHNGPSAVMVLPAAWRRRVFDWLGTIARQSGIRLHVCACKNPDLTSGPCGLGGEEFPDAGRRQLTLFEPMVGSLLPPFQEVELRAQAGAGNNIQSTSQ